MQVSDGLKSMDSTVRSTFHATATHRQAMGSQSQVANPNAPKTDISGDAAARLETQANSSTRVELGFDQTMVQDPKANGH
jgi:hypothetical protein